MTPRRSMTLAAALAAVLALGVALPVVGAAAPSATAAGGCAPTSAPDSEFLGTSMEQVYWATAPAGATATISPSDLCIGASAIVTELSNDDGLDVVIGGVVDFPSIALDPPTDDFTGVSRVDLEITDGSLSFVLELYGFFGVQPTEFPYEDVDPVSTAVGASAFFPVPGIVLRDGAAIRVELVRSTQSVTVEWVDAPTEGVRITPPAGYSGPIGAEVLLTDGIVSAPLALVQWAGVPIPTTAIWAPNPPPVAIEPGGIGYFDLDGSFVPPRSECELTVTNVPEVVVAVDSPPLSGISYGPVGILVRDPDFVGLVTVTYGIDCRLPDSTTSSASYTFLLYVGIPIPDPELAETGPRIELLVSSALALMAGGALLVACRRRVRVAGRA